MNTLTCQHCGSNFTASKPSRNDPSKNTFRKFCTKECYRKSRAGRVTVRPREQICNYCNCKFVTKRQDDRKFCSLSCAAKSRPCHNKGKITPQQTKDKIASSLKGNTNHKGKTNSLMVRIKMSASQQGIGIVNWGGFKKDADKLERAKFREMVQKKVFERDDYTCQICGERGGKLQVDHIQSWKDYTDLRFELSNCRTLCMGCHYAITFGKPMPENVTAWGHNLNLVTGGN